MHTEIPKPTHMHADTQIKCLKCDLFLFKVPENVKTHKNLHFKYLIPKQFFLTYIVKKKINKTTFS